MIYHYSILQKGQWEFIVHGRKRSYNLVTGSFEEACRWHAAIQEVIDNKPPVETPYEKLIEQIMVCLFDSPFIVFAFGLFYGTVTSLISNGA